MQRARRSIGSWIPATGLIVACGPLLAGSIHVKHMEGTSHGFVILRTADGELIATGDAMQTVKGNRVDSELVLHFKDGSLHEEQTEYLQGAAFQLITDHLKQDGPSFPDRVDSLIDVPNGRVSVLSKDGKTEESHLKLPPDVANGLLTTIIKNIPDTTTATTVPLLTTASKPRVVQFSFRPAGEESFSAGGPTRKAFHFVGHTEIGGVRGAVASMIGKQPPDVDFWIVGGKAPTFLRFRGPLYTGGPIWSLELAAPLLQKAPSPRG